jgi:diguanylate cyclase (GGDEF)-like protein
MTSIKNIYWKIKELAIYLSKSLNLPAWLWLIICYSLVVIILIIDFLTIEQITFSFFYLIPVFLVVWFVGERSGLIISLFTASTWLISDFVEHIYSSLFILYWNVIVRLGFFVVIVILLSALKSALKREEELSRKDFLTGLANSRYFYELAANEIERSNRYLHCFTGIYIDVDNFKNVNDLFGHNMGDTLLKQVADAIVHDLRKADIAARIGGDEFFVLLPETNSEQAVLVATKLHKNLTNTVKSYRTDVSFSFGVATFLKPPASVSELIRIADRLMYIAKNTGKNMIKYDIIG